MARAKIGVFSSDLQLFNQINAKIGTQTLYQYLSPLVTDAQLEDFADAFFHEKPPFHWIWNHRSWEPPPSVISLNGEATPMSQSLCTSPLRSSIA